MPASASAVHGATWAMPVDCSDHTGKLSAYSANCSCRPLTTSWSSKNSTVPTPAANEASFCSVAPNASAGTSGRSASRVKAQNFSLSAPNRIIAREDCELNEDGLRSEEHTSELQSRENLVCRL